jgi:hypothetical protein
MTCSWRELTGGCVIGGRFLTAEPKIANCRFKPPDSDALPPALQVVAHAKEVSHPDS